MWKLEIVKNASGRTGTKNALAVAETDILKTVTKQNGNKGGQQPPTDKSNLGGE